MKKRQPATTVSESLGRTLSPPTQVPTEAQHPEDLEGSTEGPEVSPVPDRDMEQLDQAGLSALEEKVIRMRYGIRVHEERPLGQKTEDPDLLEQLKEIELAAFRRLTQPESHTPRDRILERLNRQR